MGEWICFEVWSLAIPRRAPMVVQITVQVDGREVQWAKSLEGTPAEREEAGHAIGKEVGRVKRGGPRDQ